MTPRPILIGAALLALSGCANEDDKVTFFSLFPPSSRDIIAPANLPPANFEGEFWVDQNGCSYIQTGNGQWVPRMNLDRTRMCDPSLIPSAVKMAAAPRATSSTTPSQISVDPETGQVSQVRESQKIPVTYVQVGTYGDTGAGLAVREKFVSLGFPVVGKNTSPPEGRGLAVVLGPYTDSGFLEDALTTAKSLGHNDAYLFQNQ